MSRSLWSRFLWSAVAGVALAGCTGAPEVGANEAALAAKAPDAQLVGTLLPIGTPPIGTPPIGLPTIGIGTPLKPITTALPKQMVAGRLRQFVHFDNSLPPASAPTLNPAAKVAPMILPVGSDPPPPRPTPVPAGPPAKLSLRSLMSPVRDQGSRGTCVEFSTTGNIEYYIGGDISEQAMVYFYGGNDGAQLWQRFNFFLTTGFVDEQLSEYDLDTENIHILPGMSYEQLVQRSNINPYEPLQQFFLAGSGDALIANIKAELYARHPVSFGIFVPDGSMDTGNLVVPTTPLCNGIAITSANIGNCPGHAMIITGYDDTLQQFEIKNQWGTSWGNGGYGTMSYAFYKAYISGQAMIISVDTTAATPPNGSNINAQIQNVFITDLGRYALGPEVDSWAASLAGGWTPNAMAQYFLNNDSSSEFFDAIDAIYEEYTGADPSPAAYESWTASIRTGAQTLVTMRNQFRQPSSPALLSAIEQAFSDKLNRQPSAAELSQWATAMTTQNFTIAKLRNYLADSPECEETLLTVYLEQKAMFPTTAQLTEYLRQIHDGGYTLANVYAEF